MLIVIVTDGEGWSSRVYFRFVDGGNCTVIVYHLLRYGEEYVQETEALYAQQVRERLERQLHRRAAELGYEVKKVETPPVAAAEKLE
jgi:hypothetical protein